MGVADGADTLAAAVGAGLSAVALHVFSRDAAARNSHTPAQRPHSRRMYCGWTSTSNMRTGRSR